MADRKVTDFDPATSADLSNSASLMHLINPDLATAADRNKKATRAQVQTFVLEAGVVGSAALASNAVTSGKIAAGSIGSAALDSGAVTTAKIAAGAVTPDEIGSAAVQATKLAPSAVGTDKLNTAAVTPVKTSFASEITGIYAAGASHATGLTNGPSGWSASSTGTGILTVTHNLGTLAYSVVATVMGVNLGYFISINRGSNSFVVYTKDASGTAANITINFVLIDLS